MELTKGQALELHWQMWTDMMNKLGDSPSFAERINFKKWWCNEHLPNERIECFCFLCEYTKQYGEYCCDHCPIKWDDDYNQDSCRDSGVNYEESPISVILALPVREGI